MIIRNKFSGYMGGNNRLYPGGGSGGGGGGPTTNYTNTSNLPEYAQPYVEKMLGAAQNQVYQTDSSGNVTGFQPYKPYEGETVAGFTPLQKQVMNNMGSYQLPGQTGAASNMAAMSGYGAMNAGRDYQNMATNPYAMSAYMSPYMENAMAPELREARRQSEIQGVQNASQAAMQGAFGGSRQGLIEAERQRNLGMQQADIYNKGMQNAFQNAQQAQQFGSTLGLQGAQTAAQNAATLGQLGQQQYGQEMGLLGQQQQIGNQQQQYEQNRLNQLIQNYATAQQFPFIQLGTMSNLLRGLPMQSNTTQMYQAHPSMLQQGIGLAGAAANLSQAFGGKKKGGVIKSMATGGIATGVPPERLPYMLEKLSDNQLKTKSATPDIDAGTGQAVGDELARRQAIRQGVGSGIAQGGMARGGMVAFAAGTPEGVQDPEAPVEEMTAGLRPDQVAAAQPRPARNFKEMALQELNKPEAPEIGEVRKQVAELKTKTAGGPEAEYARKDEILKKFGVDPMALTEKYRKEKEEEMNKSKEDARKDEHFRWAQMFAKIGSTPGGLLKATLVSINDTIPDMMDDREKAKAAQKEIKKALYELDKTDLLYKQGKVEEAIKNHEANTARITTLNMELGKQVMEQQGKRLNAISGMAQHEISANATVESAKIHEKGQDARDAIANRRLDIADQQRKDNLNKAIATEMANFDNNKQRIDAISQATRGLNAAEDEKAKAIFREDLKRLEEERAQKVHSLQSMYPDIPVVESYLKGKPAAAKESSAAPTGVKFLGWEDK